MKRTTLYLLTLLFSVLSLTNMSAQVSLSIPDTSGVEGDTLLVPVRVDTNLTEFDVISLKAVLTYNDYYFEAVGVETEGAILSQWGNVATNLNETGRVTIAAAGSAKLTGIGDLFYIKLKLIRNSAYLYFDKNETYFNEGEPAISGFDDGYIRINLRPYLRISPNYGNLIIGDSISLNVYDNTGPVTWSTTAPDIATITSSGVLVGEMQGDVRAVAIDSIGVYDTTDVFKVYGFRLSSPETIAYEGSEISIPIYVSDLTGLNITSGSFLLDGYNYQNEITVQSVHPGPVLSEGASIEANILENSVGIAFANSEVLSGNGVMFYLDVKLKDGYTGYRDVHIKEAIFNENIEGIDNNFRVRINAYPSLTLSPNPYNKSYLAGETEQFTVSGSTGTVRWSVTDSTIAIIDENGLFTAVSSGIVYVKAVDEIGANVTSREFKVYDTEIDLPDGVYMMLWDTLYYPIPIRNIANSGEPIYSFSFDFVFNDSYLDFYGFSTGGTVVESWSVEANQIATGRVNFAGAGSVPIFMDGDLVYMILKADTSLAPNTYTYGAIPGLENIVFNEGSPNARTVNGEIKISSKPLTPELLSPADNAVNQDTALTLKWKKGFGASAYHVLVTSLSDTVVNISAHVDTSLYVSGLTYTSIYTWKIRSVRGDLVSDWTSMFTFATKEKTVSELNHAPHIFSPFADLNLNEDFGLYVVADLDTVFADQDGDVLTYTFKFATDLIQASLDADNVLTLKSLADTSGTGLVVVEAADNENASISDTLHIVINPVNDAPFFINLPDTIRFKSDSTVLFDYSTHIGDIDNDLSELTLSATSNTPEIIILFPPLRDVYLEISAPDYTGAGKIYLEITDGVGGSQRDSISVEVTLGTSVNNEFSGIPVQYVLHQNYPNPFNPVTQIKYGIPNNGIVKLNVYNLLGQRVATLVNEQQKAGWHTVSVNASQLSSGIYIYQIVSGDYTETKKMTVIK